MTTRGRGRARWRRMRRRMRRRSWTQQGKKRRDGGNGTRTGRARGVAKRRWRLQSVVWWGLGGSRGVRTRRDAPRRIRLSSVDVKPSRRVRLLSCRSCQPHEARVSRNSVTSVSARVRPPVRSSKSIAERIATTATILPRVVACNKPVVTRRLDARASSSLSSRPVATVDVAPVYSVCS